MQWCRVKINFLQCPISETIGVATLNLPAGVARVLERRVLRVDAEPAGSRRRPDELPVGGSQVAHHGHDHEAGGLDGGDAAVQDVPAPWSRLG